MNRYIVTGGAGFIGSNIVAALNARGEDAILVVDELGKDEKWRNLVGLRYEDYWERDHFRHAVQHDALGKVSAVLHMGACSSTTETDASFLAENNYGYTRDLCEWCLRNGVRFIYASSGATYGDGAEGYSDDDEATLRLRPLNMYGYSKHMFDLWALRNRLFDRIAGLKFFNVYGPREDHKGEMRSVVHKAYGQILESGEVKLFASYRPEYRDGEQVRDFVYVRDAVSVCLWLLDNRRAAGLFNVGTGKARTWLDLARAVFAALGREPQIRFIDMPEALRAKYQYRTEADISKLRRAGYDEPFAELENGVRDYVAGWLAKR
jgi:ADP-L-glycero-D-manno-heptose 6-epimerase